MKAYKYILGALLVAGGLTSCADMLQTDSEIGRASCRERV